jgi:hypothetical protein
MELERTLVVRPTTRLALAVASLALLSLGVIAITSAAYWQAAVILPIAVLMAADVRSKIEIAVAGTSATVTWHHMGRRAPVSFARKDVLGVFAERIGNRDSHRRLVITTTDGDIRLTPLSSTTSGRAKRIANEIAAFLAA